jgi:hypothetical protein
MSFGVVNVLEFVLVHKLLHVDYCLLVLLATVPQFGSDSREYDAVPFVPESDLPKINRPFGSG